MKRKRIACLVVVFLVMILGQACLATQEEQPDQIVQSVIYEGVFLDNSDVESVFEEIRGELPPYEHVTRDFHVTTAFRLETDARTLYGTEVEVRIVGYKAGEVTTEDGAVVSCEGLRVELFSENEETMDYLKNVEAVYHITGSYSDQAKYTESLDFSDMKPMNVVLKGRFGAFLAGVDFDSAFIGFDADQVDKVIEVP